MANKKIFASATAVKNHAGGKAFVKSDEQALVQYVMTGTFNDTFYVTGESQLTEVLARASQVPDEFLAKLAIYGREKGMMKDMPALLCALLVARGSEHSEAVFKRVIDNARMLRNFVQMLRSGVVGRKSLGSRAKRLVKGFIASLNDYALWEASVGNGPSLVDVMKLAHPKAKDERRNALYAYVMGKPVVAALLPDFIRDYEAFLSGKSKAAPLRAPFQKLTALPLGAEDWMRIATNARWTMTRMNLNTFARHGVLCNPQMVSMIAERLADREQILKARAFPYQLMTAMLNIGEEVPCEIRAALEKAMEVALENVPAIDGELVLAIDVSGSMVNSVTGRQAGASSKVSCLDAAALIGAALRAKNRSAKILAFEYGCREVAVPQDCKVMTIAQKIKAYHGGGTNCGSVIQYMLDHGIKANNLILVSDNESWADGYRSDLSTLWAKYKRECAPEARMINLDITPNQYSVNAKRADTLMVGGFSDDVFSVMKAFLAGDADQVDAVKAVEI
ncbi:TROVE domain-containing protein [Pseudomonas taiwanensis]|uniref:TROVE domain-containing protein n=1 Tax=Pseudomonas taiwanensis TaxID=470150 RepID=UPI0028DF45BE|nr:TROVE domain-containing protein [Pseudomonas taiwanensis]MDT8924691.1 TROVE domain-containing protein [Pseudomonas taiwanensis]